MARFIRDYSLSLTLAAFFLISWLVQTVAGWVEFVAEQIEHGATATAFGPDGYFWRGPSPHSRTGSQSSCRCSPSSCLPLS